MISIQSSKFVICLLLSELQLTNMEPSDTVPPKQQEAQQQKKRKHKKFVPVPFVFVTKSYSEASWEGVCNTSLSAQKKQDDAMLREEYLKKKRVLEEQQSQVDTTLASISKQVDKIENKLRVDFEAYMAAQLQRHLNRFPAEAGPSFLGTLDACTFDRHLEEQLKKFNFARKIVLHQCGHCYFIKNGTPLEKRFDAKYDALKYRREQLPLCTAGLSGFTAKTNVGLYWDLSHFHLEDVPNKKDWKDRDDKIARYDIEYWDGSQSDISSELSSFDPWEKAEDQAGSGSDEDDTNEDEDITSNNRTKSVSCVKLQNRQWRCLRKVASLRPTESSVYVLTNNATEVKTLEWAVLERDTFGREYGTNIACLYGDEFDHKCVVCAISLQNKSIQLSEALSDRYTQIGYDRPKIPHVGVLDTNLLDDFGYMFYWEYTRSYSPLDALQLTVEPPLYPAQPWSKDHIWRLINQSLFCMVNAKQHPLTMEAWIAKERNDAANKLNALRQQSEAQNTRLSEIDNELREVNAKSKGLC